MRASAVVKRQSTRIVSRLRCCCHAPVSRRRTPWSGMRRFRHWRASTPSSISAMFSQLPCLGRVVNLQPLRDAPRLRRLKCLVQGRWVMGVQIVHH